MVLFLDDRPRLPPCFKLLHANCNVAVSIQTHVSGPLNDELESIDLYMPLLLRNMGSNDRGVRCFVRQKISGA